MFEFLRKKNRLDEIPKRLVFKNNEAAFQYACKCLNTSLLDESPVLAIVFAHKSNGDYCLKISNTEDSTIPQASPEEIIDKGNFQHICLSASPINSVPKLNKGDLVMYIAAAELANVGMGQMAGVIIAKVAAIYDIEQSGWVTG